MQSDKSPAKAMQGATPVMRQYFRVKQQHPDALVLFRMGDFYETFMEDAKTAARILNITLTKRANGKAAAVPLAGFPFHALESYLHKLLKAGLKVAICEQVEDPKTAKGVVKREVVEIVTPGTSVSDKFLEETRNNYLVAVLSRKNSAGIAALDVSTGEFILTEVVPARMPERVRALKPSEIICPETHQAEFQALFGKEVLRLTPVEDWIFTYEQAYETLTSHFNTASLKGFGCENYPSGIAAAGAILYYLRQNFQPGLKHISKISLETDEDVVLIDDFTQRNLEIFQSIQNRDQQGTLISVLDKTVTAMGSRLLKKWVIRPLRKPETITTRLDQVAFYVENHPQRATLREQLANISDLERLMSRLSANRASARDLLALKTSLALIPQMVSAINKRPEFKNIHALIDELPTIKALIDRAIKPADLPLSIREGGFIRDGYSDQLDEYRSLVRNGKQWIANLQQSERKKLKIPSLKVGYNKVFGYYIEVTKPHIDKVPDDYIRKQTLVNSERFITEELKTYEEKLLQAEEKISDLEYQLFQDLRTKILQKTVAIQQDAHAIAQLDIIAGLAQLADQNQYCRPQINTKDTVKISAGRHPVVEELLPPGEKFIANDLEISNQEKQILIITGPNMSGKSTYLRQVGLIVLMAQMGSFVPAETAHVGLVDKIFTRVGASDNLAAGESTFLMEMNETANILNNVTPKSLVLLDEIGRGTSTYDGMAIAWAVTEYLHNNPKTAAKTLFATHYHELTELENILPRLVNLNVAVKEYGDQVVFLRKIKPGGCDKSYGVHVAQMAGIPSRVIHRSKEILANLSSTEKILPSDKTHFAPLPAENPQQLSLFAQQERELRQNLADLDVDQLTPLEALNKLDELKRKYGHPDEK